jgi:hypothetical protein
MRASRQVLALLLLLVLLFCLTSTAAFSAGDGDPSISIAQEDGSNGSYKLVVTAIASKPMLTASIAISYDNTVIAPVDANTGNIISEPLTGQCSPFKTMVFTSIVEPSIWKTSGNRTIFDVSAMSASGRRISAGAAVIEFYFKLKDGKTPADMNRETFELVIGPGIKSGSASLGAATCMYYLDYNGGTHKLSIEELFLDSFTYFNSTVEPNKSTNSVVFSVVNGSGTLKATVNSAAITSPAQVEQGKNIMFTATPDSGYRVKEWKDNTAAVNGTNLTYQLNNNAAEHTVTVEFELIPQTEGFLTGPVTPPATTTPPITPPATATTDTPTGTLYQPMKPTHPAGDKVEATKTNNPLIIEEEETVFPAVKIDGYNWLKLRDFAMLLNDSTKQFSVSYDANTNIIDISTSQVYLPVGDELEDNLTDVEAAISSPQQLRVNGEFIDAAAFNIKGYNYFRLRDLAIILNFAVIYNDATAQITLDFDNPYRE